MNVGRVVLSPSKTARVERALWVALRSRKRYGVGHTADADACARLLAVMLAVGLTRTQADATAITYGVPLSAWARARGIAKRSVEVRDYRVLALNAEALPS